MFNDNMYDYPPLPPLSLNNPLPGLNTPPLKREPKEEEEDCVEFSDNETSSSDGRPKTWSEMSLRFGKYKGIKLPQLIKTQKTRSYLRWLKKQDWLHSWQKGFITHAIKSYNKKKAKHQRVLKLKKK